MLISFILFGFRSLENFWEMRYPWRYILIPRGGAWKAVLLSPDNSLIVLGASAEKTFGPFRKKLSEYPFVFRKKMIKWGGEIFLTMYPYHLGSRSTVSIQFLIFQKFETQKRIKTSSNLFGNKKFNLEKETKKRNYDI